ncbi:hypothetical protein [Paenibacillus elgii]|nr:hypothetical protein [Paenibacillus elgii]
MKKVFKDEWQKRYDEACDKNLLIVIEYLVSKRKELDEKGYFEET